MISQIEDLALFANGQRFPARWRVTRLALVSVVVGRRLVTVRAPVLWLPDTLVTIVAPSLSMRAHQRNRMLVCRIQI